MAFCLKGNAQDDAQFTLFPWATSYYNAGGIGEQSNTLCFTLMYDNKYVGWHDSYGTRMDTVGGKTGPQDFFLSIESYHKKLHGAIGLTFISDQIGFYQNIGVKLGYAYKLRIGGGHLGIGVQASLFNQTINKDGFDPLQDGDPVLAQLSESTMDLDFSLGLMYKCDQWYAGVGVTQLVSAFDKNQALRLSGEHGSTRTPQMYFLYWGGLGYRFQDAVSLLFGARPFYNSSNVYLKGLEAGLSYGITANKLGYRVHRSFGDVEVMVRYCFDIYKPEVFSGYGSSRSIYKNWY